MTYVCSCIKWVAMSFLDFLDEVLEEIECNKVLKMQPPLQSSSLHVSFAFWPWARAQGGGYESSKNWTKFGLICLIEKRRIEYEIMYNYNASNANIMEYGWVAW